MERINKNQFCCSIPHFLNFVVYHTLYCYYNIFPVNINIHTFHNILFNINYKKQKTINKYLHEYDCSHDGCVYRQKRLKLTIKYDTKCTKLYVQLYRNYIQTSLILLDIRFR